MFSFFESFALFGQVINGTVKFYKKNMNISLFFLKRISIQTMKKFSLLFLYFDILDAYLIRKDREKKNKICIDFFLNVLDDGMLLYIESYMILTFIWDM